MSDPLDLSPVEKLTAQHEVSKFKCGQNSLDLFLRKYALESQTRDLSQTYVTQQNNAVLGYYTLVYSSIALDQAPSSITEGMPPHRPVPVMLLARWAVHRQQQRKGIGRGLLKDSFLRVVRAAEIGGLRAVLVDAIDERMADFYRTHGFKSCPVGEHKLMISIQDVRASLAL